MLPRLYMGALPVEQTFVCDDGTEINMREFLYRHRSGIRQLAVDGLIKDNDSFGFAMAAPQLEEISFADDDWNNPTKLVWFVGGWGPNAERYIANAIRKLRVLLRAEAMVEPEISTLELRFTNREFFQDRVESQDANGAYPWGDFPWGGAATVTMGDLVLYGAVSCLEEIEDDFVTKLILGGLGKLIVKGNKLLPED